MKTCKDCQEEKELDSFYFNRTCADGYESRCKECRSAARFSAKPEKKRLRPLVRPKRSRKWSETKKKAETKKRLKAELAEVLKELREGIFAGSKWAVYIAIKRRDLLQAKLKELKQPQDL